MQLTDLRWKVIRMYMYAFGSIHIADLLLYRYFNNILCTELVAVMFIPRARFQGPVSLKILRLRTQLKYMVILVVSTLVKGAPEAALSDWKISCSIYQQTSYYSVIHHLPNGGLEEHCGFW